jgi:hypothetical protein
MENNLRVQFTSLACWPRNKACTTLVTDLRGIKNLRREKLEGA